MASAVSSFCGSNVRSFKANAGLSRQQPVLRGVTAATMRKRDIHPEWHPEAKVFCNGVEVMTVGGTKETYNVDVYSGNHPFYQVSGVQLWSTATAAVGVVTCSATRLPAVDAISFLCSN
jgi:ribosomal protein L31